MVTDKPAYDELIDYLAANIELFNNVDSEELRPETLEETIESEITQQIMVLCSHHQDLESNHRAIIIREVDGIVYDIQQLLSVYWQQPISNEQYDFIHEFAGLIKNVFDSAIADLMD